MSYSLMLYVGALVGFALGWSFSARSRQLRTSRPSVTCELCSDPAQVRLVVSTDAETPRSILLCRAHFEDRMSFDDRGLIDPA